MKSKKKEKEFREVKITPLGNIHQQWLFPALLCVVTILLFANTFWGDFVFDDADVVLGDPSVRYWHFLDLWQLWGRSTRTLSLMIDYHIFGDSPAGYHFQNILWHLISVLLLYLTIIKVSGDRVLSFLCAFLFAIHPIHVEAVANISNRKEMICMVFMLASFICYLKFIDKRNKGRWLWFSTALLSWYLALNSKQVAIVLPLLLVAYEYIFLKKENRFIAKNSYILAAFLTILILILSIYLYNIELAYIQTLGGYSGERSLHNTVITADRAFWIYIGLLLLPLNLSPDHVVELSKAFFEPIVLLSWAAASGFIFFAFYSVRNTPLIAFGLFWFLINYIPVSNIVPVTYIVADRYMYIPSAGFCLVVAFLFKELHRMLANHFGSEKALKITGVVTVLLLAYYSIKTISYNTVWLDKKSLWEYTIKISPDSYRAHTAIGIVYYEMDDYRTAIKYFSKSININANYDKTYYQLGMAYNKLGNYQKSIKYYNEAISLNPNAVRSYNNLGNVYSKVGNYQFAINNFNKAIEIAPEHAKSYSNRGNLYNNRGEYSLAILDYKKAIELKPESAKTYYNLGLAYSRSGNFEQGRNYYQIAARLGLPEATEMLKKINKIN